MLCVCSVGAQSESVVVKKEADNPVGGEWIEGYSPEGYVYYWNTVTKGL